MKFEINKLAFIHEHFFTKEITKEYYPEFFKTKLSKGINSIEHIISKE